MAGLRAAEAVRGAAGGARLGAVRGFRRARVARAEGGHRSRPRRARLAGLPHGAPQPLPRPLAVARRRLSRLEPAAVQPAERALERRPGAREGALRGNPRHAARRPDARLVRRHQHLPRAPESLHHARRAPGVRARPLGRHPAPPAFPGGALHQVLPPAPGLPRRRAGSAAHLHRLHEQLHEVRQADRAAQGRAAVTKARQKARTVLVTGVAGFIGMHCAQRLLARGDKVIGVDNLNDYYSVKLKRDRLRQLAHKSFGFEQVDISKEKDLKKVFGRKPDAVLHLAAQAGVRYSLQNPGAYVQANLVGFANLLECCRAHPPKHLVFASSSSVYGANTKLPWAEADNVDHPISLYAATKKSNELMAHVYSHLFGLHT